MTTGHVFIATSFDGYVARKDHSLDWLMKFGQEEGNTEFADFVASVDGLIMGSGSFRTLLGFGLKEWPYPVPTIVLSNSMTEADIPDDLKDKVRVMSGEPVQIMETLDAEGWSRAYVDGGAVIQSFLKAGQIADMVVTLVPILLGDGIRLIGPLDQDIDLELVSAKPNSMGMVRTEYRVK